MWVWHRQWITLGTVLDWRVELQIAQAEEDTNRGVNMGEEFDEAELIAARSRTASRTKALHQQKIRCSRPPFHLEVGTEKKRLNKV